MLSEVTATRYVTPLREGGSLPGIVEADDLGMSCRAETRSLTWHFGEFRRTGVDPAEITEWKWQP